MRITVVITLTSVVLTGCATIINGRSQNVEFLSMPTGADLTVGGLKATTPAKLTLTRKESYDAIFRTEGYPDRTVRIASVPSWWLLGNLLFAGPIGLIVDLSTGSGRKLSPGEVYMDMVSGRTVED